MDSGNNRDCFEKSESISEPIKEESCKSAVVLGIVGAVVGLLFFPFIGITFAIAGLYVNSAEKKYYETHFGYKVNLISIAISIASWIIALILRPLIT
ncbi:MAG: hypothetical protein K2J73_03465 [Oscillospiraceae bacterium]|nr:hypothetical protein [Oscillospiraceae bacterium]